MDKQEYINRFKLRLNQSERFSVFRRTEGHWEVESENCRISFFYDRREPDAHEYVLLISNPRTNERPMSLVLLRFFRGAHDILSDASSPENEAEILNKYFDDLLGGDFSIQDEYEKVRDDFFILLGDVLKMSEDDPIKTKWRNLDISWIRDMKQRIQNQSK
jgi:hypothetical protein